MHDFIVRNDFLAGIEWGWARFIREAAIFSRWAKLRHSYGFLGAIEPYGDEPRLESPRNLRPVNTASRSCGYACACKSRTSANVRTTKPGSRRFQRQGNEWNSNGPINLCRLVRYRSIVCIPSTKAVYNREPRDLVSSVTAGKRVVCKRRGPHESRPFGFDIRTLLGIQSCSNELAVIPLSIRSLMPVQWRSNEWNRKRSINLCEK